MSSDDHNSPDLEILVLAKLVERKEYWAKNPTACFRFLQREFPSLEVGLEFLRTLATSLSVSPVLLYTLYDEYTREEQFSGLLVVCENLTCLGKGAGELKRWVLENQNSLLEQWKPMFVKCLGSCSTGPCIQLEGRLFENMNPAKLQQLAHRYSSEEPT
ncbi:hypothetical protein HOF92_09560 [bacterium]|nr:hypothetical protein [bacterium]